MSYAAFAAAGASIIGGYLSSQGSKKAGEASAKGSQAAIDEQRRQFDLIRSDTAPYRAIGTQAINTLGSIYGYAPSAGVQNAMTPAPSGGGGGGTSIAGRALAPSTAASGLFDPLGTTLRVGSNQGLNARSLVDPIGIFGGGGGDTQAFNKGPHPSDTGGTRFKPSDLVRLKNQGLSIDEIAKQGWLSPMEHQHELDYLSQSGFTPEEIQRLQYGASSAPTANTQPVQGAQPLIAPDYSAFYKSPDYTFRQGEGMKNIQNSFAARGGAASGNALKALTEFNSNLAAGEFGNYFNRQASLAGIGQTANGQSASAGIATGANIGNALINQGNARASGIQGQYEGINNALQSGAGNYLYGRGQGWW